MMQVKRRITKQYFLFALNKYKPLINKLMCRIISDKHQREECETKAAEEVLKCLICYVSNGSFMTFLYSRLMGSFRHMRDAEKRVRKIQNIPNEAFSNISSKQINIDTKLIVDDLLLQLTDSERVVIDGLFFRGKTMREVSSDNGIVLSTVYRIKTQAIDKMRKKCGINVETKN